MASYEELILKNPKKAFIKLAIPLIFFNVFDTVYAFISIFLAALLGYNELIAIGLATPLLTLIRKIGVTLGQGTNSYISRSLGSGNIEKANNSFMHGFLICIVLSIIIPLIGIPFLEEVMFIFSIKSNLESFSIYLIPIFACAFVFIFSEFFSDTLQAEGDSKRPTIFAIMGNILNLIISPFLAFNLNYGILGLSLGVIISSSVTFVLLILKYLTKSTKISINFKSFNFKFDIVKEILKVTIPNFLDRSLFSFLSIYINMFFTFFSMNYCIALFAIFEKVGDLIQSPSRGLSRGLLSVSGQLYGGNRIDELKSLYIYGLKISTILMIISTICLFLFHNYYLSLLMLDFDSSMELSIICIGTIIFSLLSSFAFVSCKILDGIGKSIHGLIGSIIQILLTLGFSIILNIPVYRDYSIIISMIFALLISVCYENFILLYLLKKVK